jgi:hypothetical protein
VSAALFACALAFAARGAAELPDSGDHLTGTWTNAASDRGLSGIKQGIEEGLAGLFGLGKRVARSRLLEANPPIATLELAVTDQRIRVNLGRGRNTGAAPQVWTKATSAAGDPIKIRYSIAADGVLNMESMGARGAAHHTFLVSHDGNRLRQDVTVESSRLPNDIRYSLEYRRKP